MRAAATTTLLPLLLACLCLPCRVAAPPPPLPWCNATFAGVECAVSPAFLARSALSVGSLHLPRLRAGRCLRVAVLGGSVACGQGSGGPSTAWPARLEEALNALHPCSADVAAGDDQARHSVANLCVKAVASDFWADRVAGWRANASAPGGAAELHAAHLVLLELAVNDLANERGDLSAFAAPASRAALPPGLDAAAEAVLAHTELLLLLLRALPQAPAVAYVGASSRGGRADERCGWRGDPRRCTAIALHARVARAYGLPAWSVTDAVGLLGSNASRAWYWDSFRQSDCCHPTPFGQALVARMVLHGIVTASSSDGLDAVLGDWPPAAPVDGVAAADVAPVAPEPLFVSAALVEQYRTAWPLHISASLDSRDARFRRPPTPAAVGWSAAREAGKPGVVADTVGAALTYNISRDDVATHCRAGALNVHVLKSYEHMGAAAIDVCACGSGCDAADDGPGALLASREVELTWQEHASETAVEELSFDVGAFLASRAPCLLLRLRVVSDRPPADNRVKLVGLTLM